MIMTRYPVVWIVSEYHGSFQQLYLFPTEEMQSVIGMASSVKRTLRSMNVSVLKDSH